LWAGLVASLAIGVSLGLLGAGGSIITIPVLVYLLEVDPREAVGMSLAVVGATSIFGALMHAREGALSLRTGALFAVAGVPAAALASRLTWLVSPGALLLAFAGLMLLAATVMLLRPRQAPSSSARGPMRAVAAGLVTGGLTGFLGVGGGFLIVPALALFGGLDTRRAVGTSLLVIAVNSGAGLLSHLGQNRFDLSLTAMVTSSALAGAVLGARLAGRIPVSALRRGFAVMTLLVAGLLVASNYSEVFG
jgi:uncharacterized membrane protein YfcA